MESTVKRDLSFQSRPVLLNHAVVWTLSLAASSFAFGRFWLAQVNAGKIGLDESVYIYIGRVWRQGCWPYLHTWDHKGPLIYATCMLRDWLLGYSAIAITWQQGVLGILVAALLAVLAQRLWGGIAPAVAFVMCIFQWAQTNPTDALRQTPPSLIAMVSAGAVLAGIAAAQTRNLLWARGLALLMGFCGGLEFCIKPNAIAGYGVAVAAILFAGEPRARFVRMQLLLVSVIGVLVPVGMFAILFARADALPALLDCYFLFNTTMGKHLLEDRGLVELTRLAVRSLLDLGILELIIIVCCGAVIAIVRKGWSKLRGEFSRQWPAILLYVWLTAELVTMVTNGGHSYHAFPVLPPAVLLGTWLVHLAAREPASFRWELVLVMALLFLPPAFKLTMLQPGGNHAVPFPLGWDRIAADITKNTEPGDTIFAMTVEGPNMLNAVGRRSSSRFISSVPFLTSGYASDTLWAELLEELKRNPPRRILLQKHGWEGPEELQPLLEWTWRRERYEFSSTAHPQVFPSRLRVIEFLAVRYRIAYCYNGICLAEPHS